MNDEQAETNTPGSDPPPEPVNVNTEDPRSGKILCTGNRPGHLYQAEPGRKRVFPRRTPVPERSRRVFGFLNL